MPNNASKSGSSVSKCISLLGLTDHDIVLSNAYVIPHIQKSQKSEKADINGMTHPSTLYKDFLQEKSLLSINKHVYLTK